MKLLLTSGGLENQSIINALRDLLGKDFKDSNLVFIPTAANMEAGDKWWLIKDLQKCKELGFKEVDIVDIAAVSKEIWKPRLDKADVILMGGGNTLYLLSQIKRSGLADELEELLKNRVYVGISAGSMVVAPKLWEHQMQRLYSESITNSEKDEGLALVDFLLVPHMNSKYFPRTMEIIDDIAKEITSSFYAVDDQTAVKVIDGKTEVVTEGKWKKYN